MLDLVYKNRSISTGASSSYNGWAVDMQLGDIELFRPVYLLENGVQTEFWVMSHAYEPELNANGYTLLVRKYLLPDMRFSPSSNNWLNSEIFAYLNSDYKESLSESTRSSIKTANYYTRGTPDGASDVFLLSLSEFGLSDSTAYVEGSALGQPSFQSIGVPDLQPTELATQWTRTARQGATNIAFSVSTALQPIAQSVAVSMGIRPAFLLPSDIRVSAPVYGMLTPQTANETNESLQAIAERLDTLAAIHEDVQIALDRIGDVGEILDNINGEVV